MHRLLMKIVLAFVCMPFAQPAKAFVDTPYLTPSAPQAGQSVMVNVRFGECDVFVPEDPYPIVTREGNAIRILFFGYSYSDPELCVYPPLQTSPSIGEFSPGNYTVQVDWLRVAVDGTSTTTLAILPFTVGGVPNPPQPAPALSVLGLVLLATALSVIASRKLRLILLPGILLLCLQIPTQVRADQLPVATNTIATRP